MIAQGKIDNVYWLYVTSFSPPTGPKINKDIEKQNNVITKLYFLV